MSHEHLLRRDLAGAVAAAVMSLPWTAEAAKVYSGEEWDGIVSDRHRDVQRVVESALAQLGVMPDGRTHENWTSGVKPEDLERASALHKRWQLLCQLEAATYTPWPGRQRLRSLQVSAVGMGHYEYMDEGDLAQAGINVDKLAESVLNLLRRELGAALVAVLDEMQEVGLDCMGLVEARKDALNGLRDEAVKPGADPQVQP